MKNAGGTIAVIASVVIVIIRTLVLSGQTFLALLILKWVGLLDIVLR